jgi:adenosylcobinamide-GDP ribazoletransferase
MLHGLITALRTLTVFPVPGTDTDRMESSLPWFPVVGCLLGGILYAMVKGFGLVIGNHWPQGSAILLIGGGIVLTKGFHLDGLADWSDAFFNWHDREKTLTIMKDPHTGVFGVLSIVLVILTKWISITRIIASGSLICIISSYIISRTMMVELATSFPYARSDEGTGAPFIRNARLHHRIIAYVLTLTLLGIFNGPAGLVCLVLGWMACRLLGFWSNKRIKGITGDVLGACSELIETFVLFLFATFGKKLMESSFF